jgi:sulfur carrier protein
MDTTDLIGDSMNISFSDGSIKELDVSNISVKHLLEKLNVNPVEVVIKKNDEIVFEDEIITSNDNIKVINVIFGG